jgi:hypothetical protein
MKKFFTSVPGLISIFGVAALISYSFLRQYLLREAMHEIYAIYAAPVQQSIIQIAITLLVLLSALWIILSQKYSDDTQKWAFGIIGIIVGYWLPGS